MTPQIVSSRAYAADARAGFYGYGFGVSTQPSGRVTLSHSGGFSLGAGTNYVLIPSAAVGIVVLTNGSPVGAAEALGMEFADLVQFGKVTRDWFAAYASLLAPTNAPFGTRVGKPGRLTRRPRWIWRPMPAPMPTTIMATLPSSRQPERFDIEDRSGANGVRLHPSRRQCVHLHAAQRECQRGLDLDRDFRHGLIGQGDAADDRTARSSRHRHVQAQNGSNREPRSWFDSKCPLHATGGMSDCLAQGSHRQNRPARKMKMTRYHRADAKSSMRMFVWFCFALVSFAGPAVAGEKPPVIPDQPSSLTTASRVSATVEFGLPAIASAIERDIPRRLATIDERIGCVNRRVLVFRIRANCDVDGFVDRGPLSLYGRGDHIVGADSDLRQHRRSGRQPVYLPHSRRRRGTGHGRGRSRARNCARTGRST